MLKQFTHFVSYQFSQNTVRVRQHGQKAQTIYKTFGSSKTGGGGGGGGRSIKIWTSVSGRGFLQKGRLWTEEVGGQKICSLLWTS